MYLIHMVQRAGRIIQLKAGMKPMPGRHDGSFANGSLSRAGMEMLRYFEDAIAHVMEPDPLP